MSELAYRLYLMRRALARTEPGLGRNRPYYEAKAREIAARLIAGEA